VFGVALIYTAFHLLRSSQPKSDPADSLAVRVIRRVMPVTDDYRGMALLTRVQGRLAATPLLIVIAAIVSVDIVFAMDSIPAIFGISQDAYVVFCANAFALLGLRALYFLIAGLLDRVAHLHFGLSAILGFIGMKLLMHFFHAIWPAVPEVSTGISLLVVATVLAVTCASSLLARRIGTRQTAGAVSAAPSPGPPSTNRVPGPTFAPSELQVGRNGVHRSVARWTSDRHNDEAPT
jgi:tellurite resistance protein TerC